MRSLALGVWIAVVTSAALFSLFWRIDYLRPHAIWGALSLLSVFTPLVGLILLGGLRILRGSDRLSATGWLLIGVTPIFWVGGYLFQLNLSAQAREPLRLNKPFRVAVVWGSSVMDLEARRKYSRWIYGRHAVLMDKGQTPNAKRLVTEMDEHIEAMAGLLGQPVPDKEFPWVRGSLFGQNGRAVFRWALCGHSEDPGELTYLDRHEVAHTLITALGGPDHDPPFVFIEGWAESQSSDRDQQIQHLARRHRQQTTYSLRALVEPDWYGRGSGPVYWQGGPLAHYLMQRYSPEVFFELYAGVRPNSFDEDCQRILGSSWDNVESDFWEWIEEEAARLATNDESDTHPQYAPNVELGEGVNPDDWQTLVDGYQSSKGEAVLYPDDCAFVVHLEESRIEKNSEPNKWSFEFRAVFDNGKCWIAENYSQGNERFLMITQDRSADLSRDENAELKGWSRTSAFSSRVRREAIDLLKIYRNGSDPEYLLPLREHYSHEVTFRIESVVSPSNGNGDWSIEYTRKAAEVEPIHYRVTLNPQQRWWITSLRAQREPDYLLESETKNQLVGDLFMPVASSMHSKNDEGEYTCSLRLEPLSDTERLELQKYVESISQSSPATALERWRRFFAIAAIAFPAVGLLLVGIGRRKGTKAAR